MSDDSVSSGRKTGRPKKADGPRVPYDELDRVLVFGEVVKSDDGGTTIVYPSYRDLAQRYGVAHSLIAQYSRKHGCLRRRKEAKARVAVKAEQKLVEMRAKAIAISKDDALQIIDAYLAGFGKAIEEGRVRFDNPTDFNTMLRLKEFILGGADSRQEIHAALSLEDIQARHQRMLRAAQQASAEERGEVLDVLPADPSETTDRLLTGNSPATQAEAAAGEVPGQFPEAGSGPPAMPSDPAPRAAPRRARPGGWDDGATGGRSAPHGANVAPTGPTSAASAPQAGPGGDPLGADPETLLPASGEPSEQVCAQSSPSSASVCAGEAQDSANARRSRSSATFRRKQKGDGDQEPDQTPASRVLPRHSGESLDEGSQACGEHAPDEAGAS